MRAAVVSEYGVPPALAERGEPPAADGLAVVELAAAGLNPADLAIASLRAQVGAGARAVQLFDSWVGCLTPEDYREHVQPYSRRALELARAGGVPVIHFATDTDGFLEDFAAAGDGPAGGR